MSKVELALLPDWLNAQTLLESLGPWAFWASVVIVFVECGLLMFFLPGDSLLFVVGLFIAEGSITINIWVAIAILFAAAILGNMTGYWLGNMIGPRLFDRPDARFLKHEHVEKTHVFFEKYGSSAIILARFVPIVRTFITAVAGIASMDYRKFVTYSAIGGFLWVAGVTLAGYFLGTIPFVKDNIELILIGVVLVSVIPIVIEYVRARRRGELEVAGESDR